MTTPTTCPEGRAHDGRGQLGFGPRFVAAVAGCCIAIVLLVARYTPDASLLLLAAAGTVLVGGCLAAGIVTRRRAEELLQHLAIQHHVVLAGIGGGVDAVADRVVHELRAALDLRGVALLLVEDDGSLRVRGSTLPTNRLEPDDLVTGTLLRPLAGLTIDRALATGTVQRATAADLAVLRRAVPGRGGSIAVPLRSTDAVVGVIVCDDDARGHVDLGLLEQLADLVVVTLEAARVLDREAALVTRYQELDTMRNEFIAVTSHELRTPVSAIAGAVETLEVRGGELGGRTAGALLAVARRQSDRLVRLVQDLQAAASTDRGTLSVRHQPVDLVTVVATAVGSLRARVPDVEVSLTARDGAFVLGDPDRLEQVVGNLLANAVDHGGSTVTVSLVTAGDEAELVVRDDGPGVADHVRDTLFDRFSRGSELDRHSRGMGLGLAVAHELTVAMGGRLELVDTATGAAFALRLPLTEQPAAVLVGQNS